MPTYIFDKKLFIQQINKAMKDDDFIIFSTSLHGSMTASSKKVKGTRISFGFSQDSFKNPETLGDILKCFMFGGIVCKEEVLSDKIVSQIKQYREDMLFGRKRKEGKK